MASKLSPKQRALLASVSIAPLTPEQEGNLSYEALRSHSVEKPHWSEALHGQWPSDRWDPLSTAPSDQSTKLVYILRDKNGRMCRSDANYRSLPDPVVEWQPLWAGEVIITEAAARSEAFALVETERERQISKGFDIKHDDSYNLGELAGAAASYALACTPLVGEPDLYTVAGDGKSMPVTWPWDHKYWQPESEKENLVKAGALIMAQLEKVIRAEKRKI